MVTVTLNSIPLAESTETQVVEGNHYFPPSALQQNFFKHSDTHTTCSWKGEASYFDIQLDDGTVVKDGAWYYPKPTTDKAAGLKDWVAFYKGKVEIKE